MDAYENAVKYIRTRLSNHVAEKLIDVHELDCVPIQLKDGRHWWLLRSVDLEDGRLVACYWKV